MKKKILISLLLLLMFIGGYATAGSLNGDYEGKPIVKVIVNGVEVHPEVPAYVDGGSTFLPLRAVSEALGADVKWDGSTYTATISTQAKSAGLTQDQLKEISKYVARIYAVNDSGQDIGQGSGFLITGGILVTNQHVAEGAKSLRIELNGQTYTTSDYLLQDATTDIMAVKINASGGLNYSTDLPSVDSHVVTIGFPKEKYKVSEGKIIDIRTYLGVNYISHSAMTDAGGSGSPLLNENGEVVGIVKGLYQGTDVEAAVPMKYFTEQLDKLHLQGR